MSGLRNCSMIASRSISSTIVAGYAEPTDNPKQTVLILVDVLPCPYGPGRRRRLADLRTTSMRWTADPIAIRQA